MLLRKSVSLESVIRSSEITPQHVFEQHKPSRRRFLAGAATLGASALGARAISRLFDPSATVHAADQPQVVASKYTLPDAQTPINKAASYNNFYEFGTEKTDPVHNAGKLPTRPWPIQITGMVKKPQTITIDDVMHYRPLESRIYRHRCVEAWSMIIPWDGYSLSEFINFCEPLPSAKYVQFFSYYDRKVMSNAAFGYDWPYKEGLRMDEAMNPLTLLTFGCYGQALPNQNGAPIRVIVPWKYGFKSAKSIARFHFTDKQPNTTWNDADGGEYGFFSNVNPNYDNARWSQAHERRIDSSLLPRTIPTLMFNGYSDQVAGMYAGMNLKKYF
jgi:methionine sulfoxide reductase catalytic subunit